MMNHKSKDCYHKNKPECRYCGKRNHRAMDCYVNNNRSGARPKHRVRILEEQEPEYDFTDEDAITDEEEKNTQ